MGFIPQEQLWEWVNGNVDDRAWYLATLVPATLGTEGEPSAARELLVRYGERQDVRRNLTANFGTECWMGEMSTHYAGKRDGLVATLQQESDPMVQRWLQDFIDDLGKTILWSQGRGERSQ